ncbi:MAG: phosphatidylserine decarboxylase [Rhodospirillaceae bacterium]|nr:phosphatidylserine decarboxylase [Rhodospirillaceae bacterium]MBT5244578.1 phosphatidylserine decarboxylase [Rhodospirillaceae bacterium]MBT5563488.1 phosphatidylserine decarboxylase [Rhodospirillaceae bacterium]MBT6240781.1 phosphatidylserine decarboxylase [Rhodospirillaceae bacterium]MBT7137787.1 phosphatidylserine decarboxylase [Rhodospirillaceae bacterium]
MKIVMVPINPAGWPFIGLFAAAAVGLFMLAEPLGWMGVVLTAWCAYFFRDPDRVSPTRTGLVISPADGVVQLIDSAVPPPELDMGDEERPRVCVFMNVFNVHVNRVPMDGTISRVSYRPGRFFNASLDKASEFNERMSIRMTTTDNHDIAFVQIAGLVARRIKCDIIEGQNVTAGERFGLIRFGSRVDVYLPKGVEPLVCVGQTTVAAETIIADVNASEAARTGAVR